MKATKRDIPHINFILSQDEVFQYCIDDNFLMENRWRMGRILLDDSRYYVSLPNQHCVFIAEPLSVNLYRVHVAVSPEGRGRKAVKAARQSVTNLFNDMPDVHKLIGFTPITLRSALVFSRMVGFTKEGICKKSFLKDGELHDQMISGLSREEIKQWV